MNDEQIEERRIRAYHIWEREGRPAGRHEAHWAAAEQEAGEAAPPSAAAGAPKWAPKNTPAAKTPISGAEAKPAQVVKPVNRPIASNQATAHI